MSRMMFQNLKIRDLTNLLSYFVGGWRSNERYFFEVQGVPPSTVTTWPHHQDHYILTRKYLWICIYLPLFLRGRIPNYIPNPKTTRVGSGRLIFLLCDGILEAILSLRSVTWAVAKKPSMMFGRRGWDRLKRLFVSKECQSFVICKFVSLSNIAHPRKLTELMIMEKWHILYHFIIYSQRMDYRIGAKGALFVWMDSLPLPMRRIQSATQLLAAIIPIEVCDSYNPDLRFSSLT